MVTSLWGQDRPFVHPGLLNTQEDFDRMKREVHLKHSPWKEGWKVLQSNPHDSLSWKPRSEKIIIRGANKGEHTENYSHLFNDIAAAYADAIDWKISGEKSKAEQSILILDTWASTLVQITGTSDKYLAAGIYGYEIANAAEIMRTYPGWSAEHFHQFQNMMLRVFYPLNKEFLDHHNGATIDHYWANWDLANDASMLAIGVLTDRRDIYEEARSYYLNGAGNGSIKHLVWKLYDGGIGQWQESGRDQGHTIMGVGLAGSICQMAWSQSDDLYSYDDNRLMKGAEYVARYNLGYDVPYTAYTNSDVTQSTISPVGRGDIRPVWEMLYNHYVVRKGLKSPYLEKMASSIRPEGGGGNYSPNSGGFDSLGYGTLTFSIAK